MEKRVLIAFALSTLVLSAWYYFFTPPRPTQVQPPKVNTVRLESESSKPKLSSEENERPPTAEAGPIPPPVADKEPREILLKSPFWTARFSNIGAVPTHWTVSRLLDGGGRQLKGQDNRDLELIPQNPEVIAALDRPFGLISKDPAITTLLTASHFEVSTEEHAVYLEPGAKRRISFIFREPQSQIEVIKSFSFQGDRYDFEFTLEARKQGEPLELQLTLGPNFADQSVKKTGVYLTPTMGIVQLVNGKVERVNLEKSTSQVVGGPASWAGVEDNYFALVAVPREPFQAIEIKGLTINEKHSDENVDLHFLAARLPIRAGATYTIFAGPKDPGILEIVDQRVGKVGLGNLINYGMLSGVVRPVVDWILLPSLNYTYRYVHNYGLAIIVLTFVINMLFFPLKWRSTIKMRQAAALQPRMKGLQDRMKGLKKDDPQIQRLQMEQMKLMKQANPLGGCLPMLAQLPIFWAFYVLLTVSIDVRHAPFFGWIDNLSAPDRLHILPVVMCLSMIGQSAMMPSTGLQNNPAQKVMMYVMPVMLTALFFWQAPSGLVLYWLFSNIVGVGQQYVINKLNPPPPPVDASSERKSHKKRAA